MKTIPIRPGTMDAEIVSEMERDEYHAADYVRAGDWVIDVGPYIGAFALYVKDICPGARILCFEPMPGNFAALRENLAGLAIAEPIAIVGQAGPTVIYDFGADASACHSIYDLGVEGAAAVEVPGETLAQVLSRHGIEHVRFLKLDCQGAEFDIIPSTPRSVLARIDYIAMEVHRTIAKTGVELGTIPGHREKRRRLQRHLRRTHAPLHGDIARDSIQVWGNHKLRSKAGRYFSESQRCYHALRKAAARGPARALQLMSGKR